jgi:hypothetical protein
LNVEVKNDGIAGSKVLPTQTASDVRPCASFHFKIQDSIFIIQNSPFFDGLHGPAGRVE